MRLSWTVKPFGFLADELVSKISGFALPVDGTIIRYLIIGTKQ